MKMRIKKLKQRKENLQNELYELHFTKPTREMYMQRRNEIEHEIVCIEEAIELEKSMAPFKWTLYGFIIISVGLLVWAYLKSK